MNLVPLSLAEANALVERLHRHRGRVPGYKFAIGLEQDGVLIGAAIVGRPVSPSTDRKYTAEVTRLVETHYSIPRPK